MSSLFLFIYQVQTELSIYFSQGKNLINRLTQLLVLRDKKLVINKGEK